MVRFASVLALTIAAGACASKKEEATQSASQEPSATTAPDGDAPKKGGDKTTKDKPERLPLTAEARAAYKSALRDGRSKSKDNNWTTAVTSFESALVSVPGDPRALSELGWAAFRAGDLGKAQRATLESLAGTPDSKLRAASLYNLGRIHEAREQKVRAVSAYRQSLLLRPNKIVLKRLTRLSPEAAPRAPLAAAALSGPFTTIEAFCADYSRADDEMCDPAGDSSFDELAANVAAKAPFSTVRVFRSGWDEQCSLALRTASGWYVESQFADCKELGGPWDRTVDVRRLEFADINGDAKAELIIEFDSEYVRSYASPDEEDEMSLYQRTDRLLQICGVGDSGVPSCTAPVTIKLDIEQTGPGGEAGGSEVSFELSVNIGDGAVSVGRKAGTIDPSEAPKLGRHPLTFP